MRWRMPCVLITAIGCLASCTSHAPRIGLLPTADPPPSSSARFPIATVTPSYGGPSITNCGAWSGRATTPHGTVPLLSCSGEAGGNPPPVIRVKVGDEILISGLDRAALAEIAPSPATLVAQAGPLFLATQRGTTTLIVRNWFCLPPNFGGPQPKVCSLAQIIAS